MIFYEIPLNTDLSNTSYRQYKETSNFIYIEYIEGFVGDTWEEISETEIEEVVPEFIKDINKPTQLDIIEQAVKEKNEEIRQHAIDTYTLELLEGGIL